MRQKHMAGSWLRALSPIKSMFILSFVGVVGFLATQALYVDKETSQAANFVVGTLDMAVTGPGSQAVDSLQVDSIGSLAALAGKKTWEIQNAGTLPGVFSMSLANLQNLENGCNEPEALEDSTCEDPGSGQGELGSRIITSVFVRANGENREAFSSDLSDKNVTSYSLLWKREVGQLILQPKESVQITLDWAAVEDQLSNVVQGDSLMFDIVFNLQQVPSDGASANDPDSP